MLLATRKNNILRNIKPLYNTGEVVKFDDLARVIVMPCGGKV